jgi:glyoxylase-like metal-dependent hydrolase (beta-lactamase superfamily II)
MTKRLVKVPIALGVLITLALVGCSPKSQAPAAQDPTAQSPAPAQAAQPTAGTFTIGAASAVALRDGALEFPNDNKTVGVGKTPAEVAALLTAAGLPGDKLGLNVTPLLVKAADRTLLFDTGAGTNFGPSAGRLGQSLADAGIDASSITDIFISHPHGDHVGGLVNEQGALSFPNATIHISAPDWAFLGGLNDETAASIGVRQPASFVATLTPKVVAFEPGAELIEGLVKAVEIRGHTPGHSGYLISSGASSLLYIGDTMHHFVVSVQRPNWTIAFDRDAPTAEKSRSELLAQSAQSGQRIYAVHFPYPGVGKFERRGDEYIWVPEAL